MKPKRIFIPRHRDSIDIQRTYRIVSTGRRVWLIFTLDLNEL